jgi:hypothetical protein
MKLYDTRPCGRRTVALLILTLTAVMLAGCGRREASSPGWDFAKVDGSGTVLAEGDAAGHECILDRRTGLLWEVKRADPGPRHGDATYSWFSSEDESNGGERGEQGGGTCELERCDTEAYVAFINASTLCGRDDWRMPSRDEVLTLVDPARIGKGPTFDPEYFPATAAGEYWTATTFSLYPLGAWAVDTIYGQDRVDWKTSVKHVLLVDGSKTAVKPKRRR